MHILLIRKISFLYKKIENRYFHPSFFRWNHKLLILYCSENYFKIQCFLFVCLFVCLFAGNDVKTNGFELYFCKVVRYKGFCKKLYFGYCNLFIRKGLLQSYLLERIKSLVGYLQCMVEQKHNLVGHLIFPQIFYLVGQFLILV